MYMRKFLLAILFIATLTTASRGQNKLSPLMRQTMMTEQRHDDAIDSTLAPMMKVRGGVSYISAFVRFNDISAIDSLEARGAVVRTQTRHFATVSVPTDAVTDIAALDNVDYIEMASPTMTKMDEAKAASNANDMIGGVGLPEAFDGKGVIVGVIDNGFEFGHPDFYDKDKSELRIRRVWNQVLDGTPPDGYTYGTEMTSESEILGMVIDDASTGHGTHVTGIAAGADSSGGHDYAGIAQEADIVIVAFDDEDLIVGDNTTLLDGINYIFDYAAGQGKPAVINMSLGSFLGPRDGSSSFDQMCDELQGPGRLLVGALGNDGGTNCHVSKTFDGEAGDTLRTFIEYSYVYPLMGYTEVWGGQDMDLTLVPVMMDIETGVITRLDAMALASDGDGSEHEYEFPGIDGWMGVASEINPLNGKPHFLVFSSFSGLTSQRIGLMVTSPDSGTVHVWSDNVYSRLNSYDVDGFTQADDLYTAGEIGGTGKRIISVGGYVSRDYYEQYGIYHPSGETLGGLASFTSHGPTADGRLKPEICAPSTYIASSLSVYDSGSPRALSVTWNGTRYYYGYKQGTSMAAPFVTGTLAAWLQAWPEMTPEDAKSIMQQTAINDDFTGDIRTDGDYSWGYGKLDAYEGVKECLRRASGIDGIGNDGSMPVVIINDGGSTSLLFAADLRDVNVSLVSMDGRTMTSGHLDRAAAGTQMPLATEACSPGIYVLTVISDGSQPVTEKIIIN